MESIIIVDDRPDEVKSLVTSLSPFFEDFGFEVLGFTDGNRVVKTLVDENIEPAVLVVDYKMPDCDVADGLLVPFVAEWRNCQILLYTGQANLSEVGALSRRGLIHDVLDKGSTMDDVAVKIKEMLRRKNADLRNMVEDLLQSSPTPEIKRFAIASTDDEQISAMDMIDHLRKGTELGDRLLISARALLHRSLKKQIG